MPLREFSKIFGEDNDLEPNPYMLKYQILPYSKISDSLTHFQLIALGKNREQHYTSD